MHRFYPKIHPFLAILFTWSLPLVTNSRIVVSLQGYSITRGLWSVPFVTLFPIIAKGFSGCYFWVGAWPRELGMNIVISWWKLFIILSIRLFSVWVNNVINSPIFTWVFDSFMSSASILPAEEGQIPHKYKFCFGFLVFDFQGSGMFFYCYNLTENK